LSAARPLPPPQPFDLQNAEETRKDFREIMRRYPPALGRVLKLDATLMTNPTYMASYPALVEFLKMHPEIPRYSGYFLSYVDEYGNAYEPRDAATQLRAETINMWRNTVDGLFFFLCLPGRHLHTDLAGAIRRRSPPLDPRRRRSRPRCTAACSNASPRMTNCWPTCSLRPAPIS
jgi:hypothetical protein